MGEYQIEIWIPDGNYCKRCILLEAGCSGIFDYCRLFPRDEAKADEEGILKHKNCPSKLQTVGSRR